MLLIVSQSLSVDVQSLLQTYVVAEFDILRVINHCVL